MLKKILFIVLVVATLFAFAIPCFAYSSTPPNGCPDYFPDLNFPESIGHVGGVFLFESVNGECGAITFSHVEGVDVLLLQSKDWKEQYFQITNNYGADKGMFYDLYVNRLYYKNGQWGDYASSTIPTESTDQFIVWTNDRSVSFGADDCIIPYYTDVDIYWGWNGLSPNEVFLKAPTPQIPLFQEIQGVTQEALPTATVTVAGAMKILILCGIGLLVSLMGLKLFGKIFQRLST